MVSERKEIRVKTKIIDTLRPIFENNPSLIWAMTEKEIHLVLHSYVNKIFDDIKDDLS